MGLYQSIYVGPYMKVPKKSIDSFKSEVICTSDTCRKQTNSKFCPSCGEPTQTIQRPIKKNVSAFKIICELFEDQMWVPDLGTKDDIVLPNNYSGRPFKIDIDGDRGATSVKSLKDIDKESDLNWFVTKYQHIIDKMKEEFGEVTIDWGIVVSWS